MSPAGDIIWGRHYNAAGRTDRNNTSIVRVLNGNLYVGGRVGLRDFEVQMGDGIVMKFNLNGKLLWAANYHTGYMYEKIASDWIKGLAFHNGYLYVAGYIWPKRSNYAGKWYASTGGLMDFSPDYVKVKECTVFDSNGDVKDAVGFTVRDIRNYTIENVMSFSNRTSVVSKSAIYLFKIKE